MKKFLLLIILITAGLITINAQTPDYLVSFEAEADTAGWEVFGNGMTPADNDVIVVDNPDSSAVNPSQMVLKFTVNTDADPWVGMVNNTRFVGDSALVITEENHIFTMLVHKSKVSNVGVKLEGGLNGAANIEVLVPNTVINQWEVLTFDFTEAIGRTYAALVLFPDFPPDMLRAEGTVVYLDNVTFGVGPTTSVALLEKMVLKVYPNPAEGRLYVQHPGMTGVVISNSLGQAVERLAFDATDLKAIELNKLKSGIHFVTVQSNSGTHTTRFVKK